MDVVTIGETMVLFTSETRGLMRYTNTFTRSFGGAESNLAVGLTRLGHKVGWISRLGNDEFGKAILSFIRGEGIDISRVKFDPEAQTGLYFKEFRSSKEVRVQYYRENSAASFISISDVDEDYISKSKYLHITGITPLLSDSCYEAVLKAIDYAKKNSVKVVFDPNIRQKLIHKENARENLQNIVSQSDIILPGLDEAVFLLDEKGSAEDMGKRLLEKGPSLVILKDSSNGAFYFSRHEHGFVPSYKVDNVIDPVGAGDGFASGFLSGLILNMPINRAIERGHGVAAHVITVNGDVEGLPELHELNNFINKQDSEQEVIR